MFGSSGLRVDHLHGIRSSVAPEQAERYDHRFTGNFRLAECRHALLEYTDHGKSQLTDANLASDRIDSGKDNPGEVLRQQADLAAGFHVVVIEVTASRDEQIANRLELRCYGDKRHRPLNAACDDAHLNIVRAGDARDAGHRVVRSVKVG